VQRKIKNMIAKRIKPKRRFVKLFEQNNFVTLLHVYDAYGKTKNILHIYGADGNKKNPQHVGFNANTCKKVATCLTIFSYLFLFV
jgi:hypothetical protein